MEKIKFQERRSFWLRTTALALGVFTLAGCKGWNDYSSKESFAQCDVREFRGHSPVQLRHAPVDRHDPEAIRQAIKESPDLLLATAKSLHPDGIGGDNLLEDVYDTAHDHNNKGDDIVSDYVNNPGDILCQVTPLGATSDVDRKVYFDQDGLKLLHKVEAELSREYSDAR